MSLADILKSKLGDRNLPISLHKAIQKEESIPVRVEKDKEEETEEKEDKEDKISYLAAGKYLNSIEFDSPFLSFYTILIKNPYQNIIDFRELREFILGDNQYVLNSFPSLDTHKIFSLYMQYNPPSDPYQLYQLWITLSELHLCMPAMYQSYIAEIIQKNWD